MTMLLVTFILLLHVAVASPPYTGRSFNAGTNPNLQDIFLGRCYASLEAWFTKINQTYCIHLWDLFSSGFSFKNDTNVTPPSYSRFFSDPLIQASLLPPVNKALFWSAVDDYIPPYIMFTDVFAMETSPIVDIVGDLMWCGSSAYPERFNMSSCISPTLLPFNTSGDSQWHGSWASFWAAASITYAPLATGNITILVGGNSPPAYRRGRFFGSCELPNLNTAAITGIKIIVIPPAVNVESPEPCGVGSLALLVSDLVERGVPSSIISCTDNDPVIHLIQCLDAPKNCTVLWSDYICINNIPIWSLYSY